MSSIESVLLLLEAAGYQRLPSPLIVVGTEFDFEAAVRGTGTSHDLVVIATGKAPAQRLNRLIAGLARSLDLASSRRPVSLVLLGAVGAKERTMLERYARVLPVNSPVPSSSEIEEAIAVLLPLKLPNANLIHGGDPINEVMAVLGLSANTSEQIALVRAAGGGPEEVRETLRRYANQATGWSDGSGEGHE